MLILVSMLFMPESPYYLVSKDRGDEAVKALMWLRRTNGDDIMNEMTKIKAEDAELHDIGTITINELLTLPTYWKPFIVAMALMFLQQFSGINAVFFYTQRIFDAAGSSMDPGLNAFLVALAQVIGTAIAVIVVDRFGRKILLLISDFFMAIALVALGTYFYYKENELRPCMELQVRKIMVLNIWHKKIYSFMH